MRANEFTAANYEELTKADWLPRDIEAQPIRELVKSMRRWLRGEQPDA
jgi:hypothetical protein